MNGNGRFLTAKDVALELNLGLRTVYALIANGRLKVHRFGGAVRIERKDLDEFIRKGAA